MAWPTKTDFVDGDVLTAAQVNNIGTNLNVFNPTSATNGQIWVANGSGSGSYQTPAGGWTLINTGSLNTLSTVTSSTFSGYYQIHVDMVGVVQTTGVSSTGIRLNGLTTSIYTQQLFAWNGASGANWETSSSQSYCKIERNLAAGITRNIEIDIYNTQPATNFKTVVAHMSPNSSDNGNWSIGTANISAAITSITLMSNGVTWTGGTYYIYGLK